MISQESKQVSIEAKRIYQQRLRVRLEETEFGRYVAIEPISGDYFLGDSLDDAVNSALENHPDRLTHTIRIGHTAALHLGVLVQRTDSWMMNSGRSFQLPYREMPSPLENRSRSGWIPPSIMDW